MFEDALASIVIPRINLIMTAAQQRIADITYPIGLLDSDH
jgi:hypothetical protein